MLSLVDLFDIPEFKREFNYSELPVKDFLMWAGKTAVPAAREIMSNIEEKVLRQESKLK